MEMGQAFWALVGVRKQINMDETNSWFLKFYFKMYLKTV
jgi:hypothetical protein